MDAIAGTVSGFLVKGTEALIISWSLVIFYILLFLWTIILIYSHVINLGNQKSEIIEESFLAFSLSIRSKKSNFHGKSF